ncbi:MAG: alpha/beta fold hydrolase [Deltaproteobacteria bacterium]|nr:alpha/beta fold hydrolase [Deltaproteobacteria bacterium]
MSPMSSAPKGRPAHLWLTKSFWLVIFLTSLLACACAPISKLNFPPAGDNFDVYVENTIKHIEKNRKFLSNQPQSEVAWNSPRQWTPQEKTTRGILLIHGLGDSPYSFIDIGPKLASQGYLVRAILLPGCGTKSEDMIGVTIDDWRQAVKDQAELLASEVQDLYLGGFSSGANLALEYALNNQEKVKGLLLFSPAIKSTQSLDFLAPIINIFTHWINRPPKDPATASLMRYDAIPTDSMVIYYFSSVFLRRQLAKTSYYGPTLVILVRQDSIVDVRHIAHNFDKWFPNPNSRLIWYGDTDYVPKNAKRFLFKPDVFPEYRIDSFSHMSVLFSPLNPEYGLGGSQRICFNGQGFVLFNRCLKGDDVWFSAWGDNRSGRVHARLTFNPHFDWQASITAEVLGF